MGKLAIVGAGAWGTALACHTARLGHDVTLWALEPEVAEEVARRHANSVYLPGVPLPEAIRASSSAADVVRGAEVVILVPPSQHMRAVSAALAAALPAQALVVVATKGIEEGTLKLMSDVLAETLPAVTPERLAFLSGPTFALEVARGLPTDVVVASHAMTAARRVQPLLHAPMFRVYASGDPIGVQVGGAVKNVLAVATGACDGLELGANARAALITRGLVEIARLGVALGANPLTFLGMAGVGDLVLTCTGELSRNRTLGKQVAAGVDAREYLASRRSVAEGFYTAAAAYELARKLGVDMPITENVYHVLHAGRPLAEALQILLKRSFKEELVGIGDAAVEAVVDARWAREPAAAQSVAWSRVFADVPEAPLAELAALAARLCAAPLAFVALADGAEQRVKGRGDVAPAALARAAALQARARAGGAPAVLEDAPGDGELGLFAGAPLATADGEVLGSLCVADRAARALTPEQRDGLRIAAASVLAQLELARQRAELEATRARLSAASAEHRRVEAMLQTRAEHVIRHHAALLDLARSDLSDWQRALEQITTTAAHTLGVERVSVWLFSDDYTDMVCENLYRLSADVHESGTRLSAAAFPHYFRALDEARTIAAQDARTDPRTSEFTDDYLVPLGITSMMDNPVYLHGRLVGIVCHEHTGPRRRWSIEEQDFGASIADRVTIALEARQRRSAEAKLGARPGAAR
jgi:glycerol-3-phosphate dehydrogenase (NAD(P)+)